MLSTRSWPIMGTCWWWSISPSPPRALAVAVAQDMGITVGYLPGLSMRRIADLAPGSAKTDAKDAAAIAGAARTMPQTLRAVSASDEDAAALSMLTGFDLDLARAVNQTKDRIRGQWLTPDPTPVELKRADKARTGARLKARGCRRHATWAGQDRLSPETSECHCRRHRRRSSGSAPPGQAAHRPTRPAGRCRRPGRDSLAGGPPSCARS
nr:transposase [Actinomyces naeslundii]